MRCIPLLVFFVVFTFPWMSHAEVRADFSMAPYIADSVAYDGVAITFDAGYSTAGNGYITYYVWKKNGTIVYQGGNARTYVTSFSLQQGQTQQIELTAIANNGSRDTKQAIIYVRQAPGHYYYITDHLGSVRATVYQDGSVTGYNDYYPFGLQMPRRSKVSASLSLENYTGHQRDDDTGLLYAGARYLMPSLGRWTSVDPLMDATEQIDKSPYAYAWNTPVNLNDPDGRCPMCLVPLVWGAIEIGLSSWDVYEMQKTLRDPEASFGQKAAATLTTGLGLFAPGGGYGLVDDLFRVGSKRSISTVKRFRGLKRHGDVNELDGMELKAAHYLSDSGNKLLGIGDNGVRVVLGLDKNAHKLPDFVSVTKSGKFQVSEVKDTEGAFDASSIKGIKQLTNAVNELLKQVPGAKIGKLEIIIPGEIKVHGVYNTSGNHLVKITDEGTEVIRVQGHVVHVTFID